MMWELAAEAWTEPDPLTDRERQVLRLAGEGKSSGPGKGKSDWGYAWVPVVGPLAGAVLAALAYGALK